MNCKHCTTRGNTTKYFYCNLKDKAVDGHMCKNCVMKLPSLPAGIEELFGGFRNDNSKFR